MRKGSISSVYSTSQREDLSLLYRTNSLLTERRLLKPCERILIAVSGGQDSICLLTLLSRLRWNWDWKIGVVHCDHRWCAGSTLQALHVSRLASQMRISCYQAVSTQTVNTETRAREWRYELIRRIAVDHNYNVILTAHTASDRIETLLHNLIRGTGANGFSSLSWRRVLSTVFKVYCPLESSNRFSYKLLIYVQDHTKRIKSLNGDHNLALIRPLLTTTRTEAKRIVQEWNLSTWSDASNSYLGIRRNRIRYQLLPYLREYFNPRIDYVLNNWAEIVHTENIYLESVIHSINKRIGYHTDHTTTTSTIAQLNVKLLRALPITIQRRLLKCFLDTYTESSVNFEQIEQLRLMYSINKKPSKRINASCWGIQEDFLYGRHLDLPAGTSLRLFNNSLVLARNATKNTLKPL